MKNKRKLTSSDIDDILKVISTQKTLPQEVQTSSRDKICKDIRGQ